MIVIFDCPICNKNVVFNRIPESEWEFLKHTVIVQSGKGRFRQQQYYHTACIEIEQNMIRERIKSHGK